MITNSLEVLQLRLNNALQFQQLRWKRHDVTTFVGEKRMPYLIESPSVIEAAGNKPKRIEEFIGHVNTGDKQLSVARMNSPEGWEEPGQMPSFREFTIVLNGTLRVESRDGDFLVGAGQAVICEAGEWVRYSSPQPGGADYVAICLPAFSPDSVNRDEE